MVVFILQSIAVRKKLETVTSLLRLFAGINTTYIKSKSFSPQMLLTYKALNGLAPDDIPIEV